MENISINDKNNQAQQDAKEFLGIKTGDRFEIAFNSIGMIALMRVETKGFMASGDKRSTIKSYTKNFDVNLPDYMIDGYSKVISKYEVMAIAQYIGLNTAQAGA